MAEIPDHLTARVEELRRELLDQIDDKLADFVTACMADNDQSSGGSSYVFYDGDKLSRPTTPTRSPPGESTNSKPVAPDGRERFKNFVARDSMLTELFKQSHVRSIYHIFAAVLIVLILNSWVQDLLDYGLPNLRLNLIWWCFGGLPNVLSIWAIMFMSTLTVYAAFHTWATTFNGAIENRLWLVMYVGYLLLMLVYPTLYVVMHNIPIASTTIVVCEQVRIVMKVHAFVRENVPKALAYHARQSQKTAKAADRIADADVKPPTPDGDDTQQTACPDFSLYLYFMFAPTLVYRDQYPRTERINWKYVGSNFLQVFACLFYCNYLISSFCIPAFQHFQPTHVTPRTFLAGMFSCVLPGTLVLILGFFAILHSWLNAFAEMLRFGDRMFYKDWWNSTSFSNYYRTWNVVVHDWLHVYVYQDVMTLLHKDVTRHGTTAAAISVFLLSAVIHEYIIATALRFFYPVMFFEFFGFGVMMFYVTRKGQNRGWNVLMWLSLFLGTGLMMCLYSLEYYARKNCAPILQNHLLDALVPRSWFCVATPIIAWE